MNLEGIFSTIKTTVGGMSGQMKRLEVIAENIANAQSSPDADGRIYQKKRVVESGATTSSVKPFRQHLSLRLKRGHQNHISSFASQSDSQSIARNDDRFRIVKVGGVRLVNDPTHPYADENGNVRIPDINMVEEMAEMISASRAYEANINVLDAAKQMAKRTLEI